MAAAAILAGGKGLRIGGAIKPLLVVDGQRIIDRQLVVLRPLFDAIVVVASDAAPFVAAGIDVDVIADRRGPGLGPLAGLDAALAWLASDGDGGGEQSVVCVAGDMPFLAGPLLKRLRDAAPAPAVVPRPANQPQPLCARYHRSLAPLVAAGLDGGLRAMHAFLERVARQTPGITWIEDAELRALDPDLASFVNVNTPEDLQAR
jgi:molybdopterin-guanine dinucleotide biosynthesis protein A